MNAIIEHGTRSSTTQPGGLCASSGSTRRRSCRHSPIRRATRRLVDLEAKVLIDMVEGNTAAGLRRWNQKCRSGLAGRYRGGGGARRRPGRVVPGRTVGQARSRRVRGRSPPCRQVGNRCLNKVRRRVQSENLVHRGRKGEPLYRIGKLLLAGDERLDDQGRNCMLLGCASVTPTTRCWCLAGQGVGARCISPTIPARPQRCWTRPPAAPRTPSRRSAPSATPLRRAHQDPRPPSHRCQQRAHGGPQPVREEGQACIG